MLAGPLLSEPSRKQTLRVLRLKVLGLVRLYVLARFGLLLDNSRYCQGFLQQLVKRIFHVTFLLYHLTLFNFRLVPLVLQLLQ